MRVGVAAMSKKVNGKPMQNILRRLLGYGDFEIVVFGDQLCAEEPVERWPVVEVLISFFSTGFPLQKAIEYAELRKPRLVNDLKMQLRLLDRREVYRMLSECGIPVASHVVMSRDGPEESRSVLEEEDEEYIVIDGPRGTGRASSAASQRTARPS